MRIKESQLRAIVRKEIKALMEIDEKEPETQDTGASEEQPEEQPKPEPEPEEEGPSKATQFAQKIVERLKREPELSSPESMIDMMTEFLESMGFGNEAKLNILKTVKTNTIR
jgi:hypothetical protein